MTSLKIGILKTENECDVIAIGISISDCDMGGVSNDISDVAETILKIENKYDVIVNRNFNFEI